MTHTTNPYALFGGIVLAAALGVHCTKPSADDSNGPKPAPAPSVSSSVASAPSAQPNGNSMVASKPGDAEHGKQLIASHECNRCHQGTGNAAPELSKDCVQCHVDIVSGKFTAKADSMAKWKPIVSPLTEVPSLAAAGKRFTRASIEAFLLKPHDLRPALVQEMPRLDLSRQDAKDIAAFLVPDEATPPGAAKVEGNLANGRKVLDSKGCASCHGMTGVAALSPSAMPVTIDAKTMLRAKQLAPDLRYARERFTPEKMLAWLADPKAIKPDTTMPKIPLTAEEAKDVVAYLYNAELAPLASKPFTRLPVLERKVTFEEVDKKVLHRTCWHCHAEPDYAIGDGGPGNSGGFGFKPRGMNLASYEGISAGIKDKATGERTSVLTKKKDVQGDEGLPILLRSLLARHAEEIGAEPGEIRGMPLGMPPLSAEDIQLVESWIAQGRPR